MLLSKLICEHAVITIKVKQIPSNIFVIVRYMTM